MRRFIIASLFAFAATNVFAADLPPVMTKAPQSPFLTANGSGFFFGVVGEGGVAGGSVSGVNFPALSGGSLTADGGSVGGAVGYIWGDCLGGTWCQVEAKALYQNISGGNAGGSVNSTWDIRGEADVGIQVLNMLSSILPTATAGFPTFNPSGLLPANVNVAANPRQYVGITVDALSLGGNFGSATGQTWVVAPGAITGYRWQTLGSNGQPNGGSLNIYAQVQWLQRGVEFGNVFAAGGVPVTVGAAGSLDTMFKAGLELDFAPK